jgi:hypothetical protein
MAAANTSERGRLIEDVQQRVGDPQHDVQHRKHVYRGDRRAHGQCNNHRDREERKRFERILVRGIGSPVSRRQVVIVLARITIVALDSELGVFPQHVGQQRGNQNAPVSDWH